MNIEFAGASKLAAEAAELAWFFRRSNDRYATDYPAAVVDRMSNTDSGSFQDVCPAISLRENERTASRGDVAEMTLAEEQIPPSRRVRSARAARFARDDRHRTTRLALADLNN